MANSLENMILENKNYSMFLNISAHKLLFSGYEDEITSKIQALMNLQVDEYTMESNLINGRFSLYGFRNIVSSPFNDKPIENQIEMQAYTGTGKEATAGELLKWRNKTKVPCLTNHCAHVHGTEIGFFPAKTITRNSVLYFFSPDLMR